MIPYKKNSKIKRKELSLSFYDIFGSKEEFETNEFRENILFESIDFLLDTSTDTSVKNRSLIDIAKLTRISYERVVSFIDSTILESIVDEVFHQETCSNALCVLYLFTYYDDLFNSFLVESDLFNFISEAIPELDDEQFSRCIILLINLFVSVSLEKPLEVDLIKNLLNIQLSRIIQFPNLVTLYYIIVDDEETPIEYLPKILRIFREILSQKPKITKNDEEFSLTKKLLKSKNKVFESFDCMLNPENKILSINTMNFIKNNDIIKSIYDEMNIFCPIIDEEDEFYKRNESNKLHCLSIMTQMLTDDSFFPQLTAYDFDKEFVQLCQDVNEKIQIHAIDSSVAFIRAFPNFAFKFSEIDFEDVFLKASFKIKASLIVLYNYALPLIIKEFNDFELNLSNLFLDVLLDMTDSGNEFVKINIYLLLALLFFYRLNFVFDFDVVHECEEHGIFEMVENDLLSENFDLAESANKFMNVIKGNENQEEEEEEEEEEKAEK